MKLFITIILTVFSSVGYTSQIAITDTGEEVILHDNGTWEFRNASSQSASEISTNEAKFQKPDSSNFLVKSTITSSAYWVNTKKWSFNKATSNAAAEYEFELKNGDLWGMSITEAIQMPLETLANIAFQNAQEAAPEMTIIKQEYRIVNGIKVLHLEMRGDVEGIDITYLGYYHSDDSGSTQYLTYTGTNLIDKYRTDINDFLNGFIAR